MGGGRAPALGRTRAGGRSADSQRLQTDGAPGRHTVHGRQPVAILAGHRHPRVPARSAAPVLVLHEISNPMPDVEGIRWLAEQLPNARFRQIHETGVLPMLPGDGQFGEIEEFLEGTRRASRHDLSVATVLFTDLVGSTDSWFAPATAAGRQPWTPTAAPSARPWPATGEEK
jgi:hypothetical protein